jgi:hypothetical protein
VLAAEEDIETVRRFAEKRGFSVPMYVADEIPAPLEGKTIPRTQIVRPDRAVVYRHVGAANWNAGEVRRFLGQFETPPVADTASAD